MVAFLRLGVAIVSTIPLAVLHPFFWVVILLVASQYRRVASMEMGLLGVVKNQPGRQVLRSVGSGLVGGLVGSFVLALVGVSLSQVGIVYLWPIVAVLLLINPRLMCFSYAAGIAALGNLLFGFPPVDIPNLMCLVAVLHITESLLIWTTGHRFASPLFVRHRKEGVVGAFTLQKFWPVPLAVMVVMALGEQPPAAELIRMPDWWPLVKPPVAAPPGTELVYALSGFPIPAGLAYGDIAVTCTPREKAALSARYLGAYSLLLLVLGVLSSRLSVLGWFAALFAPLGHEAVVVLGTRRQREGRPAFKAPSQGVMVLDVLPGSVAELMGLQTGEIIVEVNGVPVNAKREFASVLQGYPTSVELKTLTPDGAIHRRASPFYPDGIARIGVVLVPDSPDEPHLELRREQVLGRLGRKVAAWLRKFWQR